MKTTKFWILALFVVLTFSACGSDSNEPEQKQETETETTGYATTLWNEPFMEWGVSSTVVKKWMKENKWDQDILGENEVKDGSWYIYYWGRIKETYTVVVCDAEEEGYPYMAALIYLEKSKVSLDNILNHLSERYNYDSDEEGYTTKDKRTLISVDADKEMNYYVVVYSAN